MLAALMSIVAFGAAQENESASAKAPSVIFTLVDDNGWAGIGYNNPHISTPTLDALAADGLKLSSSYVYKYCAPTRGAFLTGRLPYKLAATRANFIPWTLPDGTHLGYAMLPKKLAAAGYVSYHVGKWHQGFVTPEYTPVGRGFNFSYGFLEGGEDHNTSATFGNACKKGEVDLSHGQAARGPGHPARPFPYTWPGCCWQELNNTAVHNFYNRHSVDIQGHNPWPTALDTEADCAALCDNRIDCSGYSWRSADPTQSNYHKCFLVAKIGAPGVAGNGKFRSASCTRPQQRQTTIAATGDNGTYTGDLFSQAAAGFVRFHVTDYPGRPMFMYYAMHDTHAPLEAPWRFVEPYVGEFPGDTKRQIFSGMLSFVDESVKNLTETLKAQSLWDNTLFVWITDNGSPVSVGGSNHPLRGGKGSNWEGGTRVPSFVTGGLLPRSQAGKVHDGLLHIVDWHATICRLAGVDPAAGEPDAVAELDGISAWPWISGRVAASSRTTMVYDHRMFLNASRLPANKSCHLVSTPAGERCASGAIRHNGWKLVVGPEAQNGWFGWFSPNISVPLNKSSPVLTDAACLPGSPCLFDLNASITEHDDVSLQHPDVVKALLQQFEELASAYHPPVRNPPADLSGYCGAVEANGNFVGPWLRVQEH